VRLSPLHAIHRGLGAQFEYQAGWQIPKAYTSLPVEAAVLRERVGVVDVSAVSKLLVKGDEAQGLLTTMFDTVPAEPGLVSEMNAQDGRGYIARLTADEFLVITSPGTEGDTAQRLRTNQESHFVTVVDQTSGLAGLLVAGPNSRELLSKLCGLSFAPADFPDRRMAQTSLAKVHALIVHADRGDLPAFELYFERPYGVYVWEAVLDAGAEFGIAPCGWEATSSLEGS
jgi:heterotetrameric sarcosine oxidase gamma subunit